MAEWEYRVVCVRRSDTSGNPNENHVSDTEQVLCELGAEGFELVHVGKTLVCQNESGVSAWKEQDLLYFKRQKVSAEQTLVQPQTDLPENNVNSIKPTSLRACKGEPLRPASVTENDIAVICSRIGPTLSRAFRVFLERCDESGSARMGPDDRRNINLRAFSHTVNGRRLYFFAIYSSEEYRNRSQIWEVQMPEDA